MKRRNIKICFTQTIIYITNITLIILNDVFQPYVIEAAFRNVRLCLFSAEKIKGLTFENHMKIEKDAQQQEKDSYVIETMITKIKNKFEKVWK